MSHWLMKSEPDVYGIDTLELEGSTLWDGICNYQARNFMRSMHVGDRAFFYHSNAKPPGIVGLMEVIETGIVDPSQFDPKNKYFDPASSRKPPAGTACVCATAIPSRACSTSTSSGRSSQPSNWTWCGGAISCRSCR
jgi:predicted RNA-binding protein with PUA-like domain